MKQNFSSSYLDNDQAWLEIGIIVLDLLHLQVKLCQTKLGESKVLSDLTFLLRPALTSRASSFPESTVATILTLSETEGSRVF